MFQFLAVAAQVANGIMIGFQTDPAYEGWEWWTYIELVFALFLMLEAWPRVSLRRLPGVMTETKGNR